MANLVAESVGNKGQLSLLVEAICRDFRQHNKKYQWFYPNYSAVSDEHPQRLLKNQGSNFENKVEFSGMLGEYFTC